MWAKKKVLYAGLKKTKQFDIYKQTWAKPGAALQWWWTF